MNCPYCNTNLKIPDDGTVGQVYTCAECEKPFQLNQSGRQINRGDRSKGGIKQIIIGCAAMGISALIVILMSASGAAIIFFGAFIFGIYMFIKGIINLSRAGISKARYKD